VPPSHILHHVEHQDFVVIFDIAFSHDEQATSLPHPKVFRTAVASIDDPVSVVDDLINGLLWNLPLVHPAPGIVREFQARHLAHPRSILRDPVANIWCALAWTMWAAVGQQRAARFGVKK
jgi:hypothetical protein